MSRRSSARSSSSLDSEAKVSDIEVAVNGKVRKRKRDIFASTEPWHTSAKTSYPPLTGVPRIDRLPAAIGTSSGVDDADESLPSFLINALVQEEIHFEVDMDCPFKSYIPLGGRAWSKQGETDVLIVRKCYSDLLEFVSDGFKGRKDGDDTISYRVITGTPGIGKTMFGLYLARTYFRESDHVLLYYGEEFWAFTQVAPQGKLADLLSHHTEVDSIKIWHCHGFLDSTADPADQALFSNLLKSRRFFLIRDPGMTKNQIGFSKSCYRQVYTLSSGQRIFFGQLEKTNDAFGSDNEHVKYGDLWSGEEIMFAARLGFLPEIQQSDLHLAYIVEGYRRFGGSIRNAMKFAKALDQGKIEKDSIEGFPLSSDLASSINRVAEEKSYGREEEAKTKAMVYHKSPTEGYGKSFQVVAAALSVTSGHQSAYGALYEEDAHTAIVDGSPHILSEVALLGWHKKQATPNIDILEKSNFRFDRNSPLYFPGQSLGNVQIGDIDNLMETYFHPLSPGFPTHDSFIICAASCFFTPSRKLDKAEQERLQEQLDGSVVLVGLQMTVSACDESQAKPSHTVFGTHLSEHLQSFTKLISKSSLDVKVFPDIITVFVSPNESCRKMNFMPVLTSSKTPMKTQIRGFHGMAPQFSALFEAGMIYDVITNSQQHESGPTT